MKVEPTFDVEHVASTVVYMSNLLLDTNVQFVTIMATDMPYIGRGLAGFWLRRDQTGKRRRRLAHEAAEVADKWCR